MAGPVAALLGDATRLHLQHGPIDLLIGVDAPTKAARQRAFEAGAGRFDTILSELVGELALLRRAVGPDAQMPVGDVARRMHRAARPFAGKVFVTRMAAVAGAVADEVLASIVASVPLSRAHVNNGGDIALHLAPGADYTAAIAGLNGDDHGRITIDAASDVRGIATSGQGGRSLSMGIADSVTVLADNAARADVAATLIANAVDLPGCPAITRSPANALDPDSDLGHRLVVTHVGPLAADEARAALDAGARAAQSMFDGGLILGAALSLNRCQRIVGPLAHSSTANRMVSHA